MKPRNTSRGPKLLISIKLLHRKSLKAKVHQKRDPIVQGNEEGFRSIFQKMIVERNLAS
jgi:hypothetical protein